MKCYSKRNEHSYLNSLAERKPCFVPQRNISKRCWPMIGLRHQLLSYDLILFYFTTQPCVTVCHIQWLTSSSLSLNISNLPQIPYSFVTHWLWLLRPKTHFQLVLLLGVTAFCVTPAVFFALCHSYSLSPTRKPLQWHRIHHRPLMKLQNARNVS